MQFFQSADYSNIGCQVSKRGIQNQIDFWPKINHIQRNLFHFVNRCRVVNYSFTNQPYDIVLIRYRQRFFDQVGHENRYASIGS